MPDQSDTSFAHRRLDAWNVAVEMACGARDLAKKLPYSERNLRDQLTRAATSAVLNIAEGANRASSADKRNRFAIARGEVGELAAGVDLAVALGLARRADADRVLDLAGRVAAMLTGLMKRLG